MVDYLRKIAENDVAQGRLSRDMRDASSREKEVHDAARAAALAAQNKK